MVRKPEDQPVIIKKEMYDGPGQVEIQRLLLGPEEMNEKGRLFSRFTIQPSSGIGYHVHEHESETFYILHGTGVFDDNGSKVPFTPGDVLFTAAGNGHSVTNTGTEVLEFVGMILYE